MTMPEHTLLPKTHSPYLYQVSTCLVQNSNHLNIQSKLSNNPENQPFDRTNFLTLSSSLEPKKSPWTFEEEQMLFQLHNLLGNKWSIIAQHFSSKQKSDNCVKNHFYSRLRKALRKLNKIVQREYKKHIKEIKQNVIYKIIEITELKHKKDRSNEILQNRQNIHLCQDLKNCLLNYSYDHIETDQNKDLHTGRELIQKMLAFIKQHRKILKKPQSQNLSDVDKKKKSKKSSLLRQTKNFGTILVRSPTCDVQEESFSSGNQVRTRNGTKSRVKIERYLNQSQNSSPTMAEQSVIFKEKSESFFNEVQLLDEYFSMPLPLLARMQSSTEHRDEQINEGLKQFEIFESENERRERLRSQDHFEDPQLDEGKFSIFE